MCGTQRDAELAQPRGGGGPSLQADPPPPLRPTKSALCPLTPSHVHPPQGLRLVMSSLSSLVIGLRGEAPLLSRVEDLQEVI
jgi:hypothetical protein